MDIVFCNSKGGGGLVHRFMALDLAEDLGEWARCSNNLKNLGHHACAHPGTYHRHDKVRHSEEREG